MITPKVAWLGIVGLLTTSVIIATGSFALVGGQPDVTVTQVPDIEMGRLAETISFTGLPIVFSEDDEPTTDADAEGLSLTSKQTAIVNFIADVGERVEVVLRIDNLNDETRSLALVNILASDNLLIDVLDDAGTSEVRLIGHNQYVMEVESGAGHSLRLRITPLEEGVSAFLVEIAAVG